MQFLESRQGSVATPVALQLFLLIGPPSLLAKAESPAFCDSDGSLRST